MLLITLEIGKKSFKYNFDGGLNVSKKKKKNIEFTQWLYYASIHKMIVVEMMTLEWICGGIW